MLQNLIAYQSHNFMISMFKKIASIVLLSVIVLVPLFMHAQTQGSNNNAPAGTNNTTATLQNPLNYPDLQSLIFGVINIVLKFAYIFIALSIIWGGFKLIAAQGKPEKIKDAKKGLTWTLIGAAIVIGANVIASVLQNTINSLTK